MDAEPLIEVKDLHVRYGRMEAVKGVSFSLARGETLGIVGESGSGKSTIAKTLIGLERPFSGSVTCRAKSVQMVFQDAVGSLNPRMTVRQALEEVFRVKGGSRRTAAELLDIVGLSAAVLEQYPREMSGGQCQRVSVARALACEPEVLVADEPVSALDVSVQARILNLLRDLRRDLGLSILLIAHDLAVVKNVCDRVCVMQSGEFVDAGTSEEVFAHPKSAYTKRLLAAVPDVGRALSGRFGRAIAGALVAAFAAVAPCQAKPVLIYNEDDSHFMKKAQPEAFVRYLDSVCRGAVTHFFMCPNAMRSNVESRHLEPLWKALAEPGGIRAVAAKWLHDNGIDPYAIWAKRARERGVSPWFTVRMNDIHFVSPSNFTYCGLSTLWKTRPDLRRDPNYRGHTWHWYAFDYAHREVREQHIGYIRELLSRYDVDGLELDWMRFPHHFAPGRERADAHFLTDVVRAAKRAADDAAKRLGHPVKIGCRVTTTYEGALELGTDPVAWAKEGLIDMLVACNFFATADFNLPYADWAARIHAVDPHVMVVPGTDSSVEKERLSVGHSEKLLSVPEIAGWCDTVYSQGAPGFYVFNPFHHSVTGEVWNALLDGRFSPEAVRTTLPRSYPVSHREYASPAVADIQLPVALSSGADIHIPVGTRVPEGWNVNLKMGFSGDVPEGFAAMVRLNGEQPICCLADAPTSPWLPATTKVRYVLDFSFAGRAVRPRPSEPFRAGTNHVTFAAVPNAGKCRLLACELDISPPSR
jgi:ABC-type dipeptide/oligopeptide/nickel transport system ATPase subunit